MALKSIRNAPVGIGQYTPIGKMHTRVQFLSLGSPDNLGNYASPALVIEVWASVQPMNGFARLRADQVLQKQIWKIVCSYVPNIDESMLVSYEGNQLQIDNCYDPDGRQVELHALCSAVDTSV
jgi:SPP1 family predicted phage head-tail adaptor